MRSSGRPWPGPSRPPAGCGQALDHDAYFALPEDQRLAFTALNNAGYVPEEVDSLKEIKTVKEKLAGSSDPVERDV